MFVAWAAKESDHDSKGYQTSQVKACKNMSPTNFFNIHTQLCYSNYIMRQKNNETFFINCENL